MTVLTAYAPSYLPWPGLFDRVSKADIFVLTDTDRLNRKDFHTRNRIVPGGPWLTVPVLGGRDQRLCDVRIDNTKPWRRKHWASIEHAYGNTPRFEQLKWWFKPIYDGKREYELLGGLNGALIAALASALLLNNYKGFWSMSHPWTVNIPGSGSEFILNICKHFQADTYLCGSAGRAYLDLAAFEEAGVEVRIEEWQGEPVSAIHHLFMEGAVL